MSAQSGEVSAFWGSLSLQRQRRRRWPGGSFQSRFEERMEIQARIELALLAALLNVPARATDRPGPQPASWAGDPVRESQDQAHDSLVASITSVD